MRPDSERHYWDALHGGNPQTRRFAAHRLSSLLRQRGKLVAAERLLRKSLNELGREGAAGTWLRLANLLLEEGRQAEAGRAYARALNLATVEECPEVIVDLAARCVDAGEARRASELYGHVVMEASEARLRALAAYRLAAIQLRLDSPKLAIATLRQALVEADPSLEPFVLVDLAKLLIDVGQPKDAVGLLQRAIESDHHDQAPRAALALAELSREKDPLEAYRLFQLVIECEHPTFASRAAEEQERLIRFEIDSLLSLEQESEPEQTGAEERTATYHRTVFLDRSAYSLYRESFKPDLLATWVECELSWTSPRHRKALFCDSLAWRKPQIDRGFVVLLPFQLSRVVALCEDLLVVWLARRLLADGNLRVDGWQAPRERLLCPSLPKDRVAGDGERSPLAIDLLAPESPRCDLDGGLDGLFLPRPHSISRTSKWFVLHMFHRLASRALEVEPFKVAPQPDGDCLPDRDVIEVASSRGDGRGDP